jgi:hypothetical protein
LPSSGGLPATSVARDGNIDQRTELFIANFYRQKRMGGSYLRVRFGLTQGLMETRTASTLFSLGLTHPDLLLILRSRPYSQMGHPTPFADIQKDVNNLVNLHHARTPIPLECALLLYI